jgi:hypothetical protein
MFAECMNLEIYPYGYEHWDTFPHLAASRCESLLFVSIPSPKSEKHANEMTKCANAYGYEIATTLITRAGLI